MKKDKIGSVEAKTPLQVAEEEKFKAQQETAQKIQQMLEESGLMIVAEHLIRVVPKR